ncbi:MAG: undecaprenyldiphospho-muramoylpentapeptide beta-N-acetylglucosaminyltransferase [Gammaproteobacteria bacterium]|nr:undecaprenyldiphospho-muramoylpentapeptide beta-N-acetylglucosaminyltransferase [Gammaproteobacteria bacterium]
MSAGPILIMAGGTGGHVFPALAVAQALQHEARQVVWVGTRQGLEAGIVPDTGIPMEWISVHGLRGKGLVSWLLAPFKLIYALSQAVGVMRRQRPAAVLGMGGFVAGPGGVAAGLLRKPLIVHEQNAVAGLTNRVLAKFARTVLEAFPHSFPGDGHARTVGNPVRPEIARMDAPTQRFEGRSGAPRLLVLGGSQGARALNIAVPRALALMERDLRPEVWHQAGERTISVARDVYRDSQVEAQIDPFIDDMAAAYAWADFVVCRAGALTVFELAAAGIGAVLVPYPSAVDDHQTLNARYLTDRGAALLLPESELTSERLAELLQRLVSDPAVRLRMASAARELATPRAVDLIRDAVLLATGAKEHGDG